MIFAPTCGVTARIAGSPWMAVPVLLVHFVLAVPAANAAEVYCGAPCSVCVTPPARLPRVPSAATRASMTGSARIRLASAQPASRREARSMTVWLIGVRRGPQPAPTDSAAETSVTVQAQLVVSPSPRAFVPSPPTSDG
ncbi:hypothetical protein [Streptomyces sp. NBC_01707]|uniref:hypothetical protein n=1 Tax=Streptomyces sp. NBC_01707 TaxID=2975914 RepID=UPI002F90FEDB